MFVIIPVRVVERLAPAFLLLGLMFTAGIAVSQMRSLFFTASPSPVPLDLIVILMAVGAGSFLLRLGTRLFKSPAHDEAGGILSKIGFKAWVVFLTALAVFAAGAFMGGAIDWSQFESRLRTTGQRGTPPTTHRKIYFAPAAPAAPSPTTPSRS